MTTAPRENPYAGQGAVLLDVGDDVGALVVTMPASMEGAEVEIRPFAPGHRHGEDQGHDSPGGGHANHHQHSSAGGHHPHVAVVNRPVRDRHVPSLVFPELVEGRYELCDKGSQDVRLTVDVRGGEVTTATWPR